MAIEAKTVDRQELVDRIAVLVEKAARNGGTIRLGEAVKVLLNGDETISTPLVELEREIIEVATHAGVGVDFSDA